MKISFNDVLSFINVTNYMYLATYTESTYVIIMINAILH